MQDALAIMVQPLETFIVGLARLEAVIRGFRGGALGVGEFGPLAAVVGFVGFGFVKGGVFDVVGEVVPVGAEGLEVGVDEVFEDFHEDEGGLE